MTSEIEGMVQKLKYIQRLSLEDKLQVSYQMLVPGGSVDDVLTVAKAISD